MATAARAAAALPIGLLSSQVGWCVDGGDVRNGVGPPRRTGNRSADLTVTGVGERKAQDAISKEGISARAMRRCEGGEADGGLTNGGTLMSKCERW